MQSDSYKIQETEIIEFETLEAKQSIIVRRAVIIFTEERTKVIW
jgi:hypothetical protein